MYKKTRYALVLFLGTLLTACGSGEQGGDSDVKETQKIDTSSTDKADKGKKKMKQMEGKTYYQVPTPNRMFEIISKFDKKPDKGLLSDPSKVKDLMNKQDKALNLGIYSTDLAYTSTFNMGTESLKYFRAVQKIGDDLGISSAFDKETVERIEKNVGNGEALAEISKDTYFSAFAYLEKNDRGPTLALLVAGGWVESLYLATQMVDEYEEGDPVIKHIAEQKYSLENLVKFMEKYEDDKGVKEVLKKMKTLKKEYDKLSSEGKGDVKMEKKNGRAVLSGGKEVKISEKELDTIREHVKALRNDLYGSSKNS